MLRASSYARARAGRAAKAPLLRWDAAVHRVPTELQHDARAQRLAPAARRARRMRSSRSDAANPQLHKPRFWGNFQGETMQKHTPKRARARACKRHAINAARTGDGAGRLCGATRADEAQRVTNVTEPPTFAAPPRASRAPSDVTWGQACRAGRQVFIRERPLMDAIELRPRFRFEGQLPTAEKIEAFPLRSVRRRG